MTTRNNHELHIRRATEHDIPVIWKILKGEIEVMRRAGRDQWQYGYPNPDTVASDIEIGQGWVLLDGTQVVGYCAFITAGDPCYDHQHSSQYRLLSLWHVHGEGWRAKRFRNSILTTKK